MDIIFQGMQNGDETAESLGRVIKLFQERYQIRKFREIRLSVTLVDEQGDDVELVDSETLEVYRTFEVHREHYELGRRPSAPMLKLVIDNTR